MRRTAGSGPSRRIEDPGVTFRKAAAEDLSSRALGDLVGLSVYQRDEQRVDRLLEKIRSGATEMYLALDGDAMVGQMMVARTANALIESISVDPGHRRSGVGRYLIQGYLGIFEDSPLEAETDGDAVEFYHRLGFKIRSLGEKYPGVTRFICNYNHALWDPLPYKEAFFRLQSRGIRAWVAGGWALDLFLGRQTRPHGDTDIVIRRSDQARIADSFPGWEVFRTHAPGLSLWDGSTYLDTTPNVWLREGMDRPWSVEIMFLDEKDDRWVYRRNPDINGRIDDLGLVNGDGIRYLRPEIQLLFKGGSSKRRKKDTDDFLAVLPHLPDSSKEWLARSLEIQFPQGHDWIVQLRRPRDAEKGGRS
jgi:ribosomal protein S18 acetylase RimI-like enzyme